MAESETRAPAAGQDTPWLRRHRPRPDAEARVVCFGPAGGSPAFFRGWADRTPSHVEVQTVVFPGRESRWREPSITDMGDLADAVGGVLAPRLDRPTVLFGHSMGASVAFETARRLEATGAHNLAGLVVSGRPSPARQREFPSDVGRLDDAGIIAHLRELGGTPQELLDDPDVLRGILPAFRDDFRLVGDYVPAPRARTAVPMLVLHGADDPGVPAGDAPRWGEAADRLVDVRALPGGHFYLVEHEPAVVGIVLAFLAGRRR